MNDKHKETRNPVQYIKMLRKEGKDKAFSYVQANIRKATGADIDPVMDIVWRTIMMLESEGNHQWSSSYPTRRDFIGDITAGNLYACEVNSQIVGFICCDDHSLVEYASVKWKQPEPPFVVIHRFAVSPEMHRSGIGSLLLAHAEQLAKEGDCKSVRTDTCCLNFRMKSLLKGRGYEKRGEVKFPGCKHEFHCFEKIL